MNRLFITLLLACSAILSSFGKKNDPYIIAYVTSWSDIIPDPSTMTHINYAFGHVNDTFDGIGIDNPDRLRSLVALRKINPDLKVLLSVGGWGSGRFSEMVTSESNRSKFCRDAVRVIDEYGLDGIDIDWEYPGENGAGISAAPTDIDNFSKLMNDLREAIGKDKLLTLATFAGGKFYSFSDFISSVDFVNIMTYDMTAAPGHHAPLYNSDLFTGMSCDSSVKAHMEQGVPAGKICLGLPFYGRGLKGENNFVNYREIGKMNRYKQMRDTVAKEPYLVDEQGLVVLGYDDAESLAEKCRYAKEHKLAGVMYWDYDGDDESGTLRNAVKHAME